MLTLDIQNKIRSRLGWDLVNVELGDTTSAAWYNIMDDTYRWFVARKGVVKKQVMLLQCQQSEYDLPANFKGLSDWIPPGITMLMPTDPNFVFDPMFPLYQSLPQYGRAVDWAITQMWIDALKWDFTGRDGLTIDLPGGKFYVHPTPSMDCSGWMYYTVTTLDDSILPSLMPIDLEIVINVGECFAKMYLGRIRSKFSSLQVPGGTVELDGKDLIAEAKEQLEKLEDRIAMTQDPYPILVG
jgi:hypothetical protein